MLLEIPGQMRGPECRSVAKGAVVFRKSLESTLASVETSAVSRVCIILRVAGSLGDFGPDMISSPTVDGDTVECEVVLSDRGWAALSPEDILVILSPPIREALRRCLNEVGVAVPDSLR